MFLKFTNRQFNITFFLLCLFTNAFAQSSGYEILLESGSFVPLENTRNFPSKPYSENELVSGRYYRILQFYSIPLQHQKEELEKQGIIFLEYIPNKAYKASIPENFNLSILLDYNLRSITEISPVNKLTPQLAQKNIPFWAREKEGKVDVVLLYYSDISAEYIHREIERNSDVEFLSAFHHAHQITVRIPIEKIFSIASLPFVSFMEPVSAPAEPDNLPGVTNHRSNVIASSYDAGRKYDGTGVKIAMGDDGAIGPHIDFQGRSFNNVSSDFGDHGDHVAGIIMGAGNLDPKARGMAFGAELYIYSNSDIISSTPSAHTNLGVRITSNSWGRPSECNFKYDFVARTMDQQIRQRPSLMHVFSSGNLGTSDCGYGAGATWGNLNGGLKMSKNHITVGNLNTTDGLNSSSSRGPASDGRIKPDLCAVGTNVYSTMSGNNYASLTGTSMSCPGVSGTLAQLYHAYKSLNNGIDPESALMKAIMMNTADDLGNPGPDFKFGYGRINAMRAVKTIEENNYLENTIAQADINTHEITVPAGVKQLRIMLYWPDFEAVSGVSKALVNDLDMILTDPSTSTYLPWVLNHAPNATTLDLPAIRGEDHLNNVEQITVDDPEPGIYTVEISGFEVPQGPQKYFIVYEFVTQEIILTYPIGGESFTPGSTEIIRWDAPNGTGPFTLEYSSNAGGSWTTINSNISSTRRSFSWNPPSLVSGEMLMRISAEGLSSQSSEPFSLIGVPTNINVDWACPDSIRVTWNSVAGATSYEISLLGEKYMDLAGSSTTNSIILYGISPLNEDWLSVKALGNTNAVGERALAIKKEKGTKGCVLNMDIEALEILNPSGTLMACNDNTIAKVELKLRNSGTQPISNIPVHFKAGNAATVTENISGPIASGDTITYTFNATANLSLGSTILQAWTSHTLDKNKYNDTLVRINSITPGKSFTTPYTQDFETFSTCDNTAGCENRTCTLRDGWFNERNNVFDQIDWRTNSGPTPISSTGPSVDHAPGTSEGKYLYLQSRNCFGKNGSLISPCIELNPEINEMLTFWYHMRGSSVMGSLHVDIFSDGKWIYDAVPPVSGNQGEEWKQQVVDLSPYKGMKINVRIRGLAGNTSQGDIAIDNFSVTESTLVTINNLPALNNVKIFPNPSSGLFNLEIKAMGDEDTKISVADIHGKKIITETFSSQGSSANYTIDLSANSKGIYFLHLENGDNKYNFKLIHN
jgi:subtilisin family serine protease